MAEYHEFRIERCLSESDDPTDTVTCPVCYEQKRLVLSICKNKHWICIDCFEKVVCKILMRVTVLRTLMDVHDKNQSCPLCRGGDVGLAIPTNPDERQPEPAVYGCVYVNESPMKLRPVTFRGARYRSHAAALSAWYDSPYFVYECVYCGETVQRTKDVPQDYIRETLGEHCTACDVCGDLFPWGEALEHIYRSHLPEVDFSKVPRRCSKRLLQLKLRQNSARDESPDPVGL